MVRGRGKGTLQCRGEARCGPPCQTGDDLCPPSLASAFRLLPPPPASPAPWNQDHLSSRSLFILRSFFFCKKQSQKPVQNHPSGRPVLYYKSSG